MADETAVHYPFARTLPQPGEAIAVAPGVWWIRMPLPFALDHNRMTVEVEFPHRAGGVRKARAWVDTGGTDLLVSESLARDLDIEVPAFKAADQSAASPSRAPVMRVGGVALDTAGMTVAVRAGRVALPGIQAECTIAPRCLRRLHVVFDYPARRLTLARPGVLKPTGTPIACRVNPETGLFMIQSVIDRERLALGVDNGSAGTRVSDTLTAAWLVRHADWSYATGAAGSTNVVGFPFEAELLIALPLLGPVSSALSLKVPAFPKVENPAKQCSVRSTISPKLTVSA